MQTGEFTVCVEATCQSRFRDRVIKTLHHIFLATPHELHRTSWLGLRDQDCLTREIVEACASAEATAKTQLMDINLLGCEASNFNGRAPGAFTILGGTPDIAL